MFVEVRRNIYYNIKFTQTKSETALGINVDLDKTNMGDVYFGKGEGTFHIAGTTNLNYNEVRCISDIDFKLERG